MHQLKVFIVNESVVPQRGHRYSPSATLQSCSPGGQISPVNPELIFFKKGFFVNKPLQN